VGVELTDRELLTLRTFASALRTAVRNASAFAEARRLALRNAHAALHDPLTGLANRRRLQEYAEDALGRPGETSLVVLDIDLFREVNETLGYLAGDRLLVEVARRLKHAVGPDDLVARLDGDEFAVVLGGVTAGHRRTAGARAAGHPRPAGRPGRHAGPGRGERRPRLSRPGRGGCRRHRHGRGGAVAPGRRGDVPGQAQLGPGWSGTRRPGTPPTSRR
jgi:hypothetical protein